jgi:hypothetical protein
VRIFSTKGSTLIEITEEQFPLEKEIQRLTEANLQAIFDLDFVRSEFELQGLRIDTLSLDRESKAFVNTKEIKISQWWTKVWHI